MGCYIVEFEQNGEDRANYGDYLTLRIAKDLTSRGMKGMSQRSIKDFRQFYQTYPHILQTLVVKFTELPIGQPLAAQLQIVDNELLSAKLTPENLLAHFSFRHFTALMRIKDPLKRAFYEKAAIKGKKILSMMTLESIFFI